MMKFKLKFIFVLPILFSVIWVCWSKYRELSRPAPSQTQFLWEWVRDPYLNRRSFGTLAITSTSHNPVFKCSLIKSQKDKKNIFFILCSISDQGEIIVFRNDVINMNSELTGIQLKKDEFSAIIDNLKTMPQSHLVNNSLLAPITIGYLRNGTWNVSAFENTNNPKQVSDLLKIINNYF